jgi:hypothetical protein
MNASTRPSPSATNAFGPRSFRVARFILASRAPTLIDLLDELAAAWPDLSFNDFRGGFILHDMLIRYPDQIRPVAEGMPPPRGDPLAWLDRVIALTTTSTRGRAS